MTTSIAVYNSTLAATIRFLSGTMPAAPAPLADLHAMLVAAHKAAAKAQASATVECPRCKGTGVFVQFSHVRDGACFLCAGKGDVSLLHLEKAQARLLAKAAKAEAAKPSGKVPAEVIAGVVAGDPDAIAAWHAAWSV